MTSSNPLSTTTTPGLTITTYSILHQSKPDIKRRLDHPKVPPNLHFPLLSFVWRSDQRNRYLPPPSGSLLTQTLPLPCTTPSTTQATGLDSTGVSLVPQPVGTDLNLLASPNLYSLTSK